MLKQYELLQIGQSHLNFCEDFLVSATIGAGKRLIAVMDGCSMGKESTFAALLCGKLLRKISLELYLREFAAKMTLSTAALLNEVLARLFAGLKTWKNELLLTEEELLNTLILGVVDEHEKRASLLIVGDGLVVYNGRLIEYDQDNQPDYLGYHLDEDFVEWLTAQTQQLDLTGIYDLAIVTDGIFSFAPFSPSSAAPKDVWAPAQQLLVDDQWRENEHMLRKKLIIMEEEQGLQPYDDLAIIRLIFD